MKTSKKELAVLLILIGFFIYFFSLFNGFVWDDEEQIVNNQAIKSIKNFPFFFTQSTFNSGGARGLGGMYYKPMMPIFYTILYYFFGNNSGFFHLFQVLLHGINGVLVFLIFCLFFNQLLAFFLSLIFLVHPINVETVVYSAGLQEVLFMFFGLLAVYINFNQQIKNIVFLKYEINKNILVGLFLLLSLFSKETGVLFILIMGFYNLLNKKINVSLFLSLSLPIIVYSFFRFGIAQISFLKSGVSPISRASLYQRLITIPKIIIFYLKTIFFPKDLLISQHWIVEKINFFQFWLPLLINFLLLIIWLVIVFAFFKKNHLWYFFSFWFFISLIFHLQIFPLDLTVSDRWAYLMLIGILGMIGVFLEKIKLKTEILRSIFILIFIVFSLRTVIRIFNWHNGLTLFGHDIKFHSSFDLENNYGVELYRNGEIDKAKTYFENSIKLAPYWWINWNNLGAVYQSKNDLKLAEECYLKSIKNGDYYLAYENYVKILIKQNKFKECLNFLEDQGLKKFPYNQVLNELYFYCQDKIR